jgi:hypothetical protein
MRFSREQLGMLVIREEPDSPGALTLPTAIAPLGYRARFHKQRCDKGEAYANFWFEVSWKQPEIAGPPLDLLKLLNEQYSVVSFELAAETHH